MPQVSVLIVEDDWFCGEALKLDLEQMGHRVIGVAQTGAAALEVLMLQRPDLVFVDTELGAETSEMVVDECRLQRIPTVICSGHAASQLPAFCAGLQAISKPYMLQHLADTLRRIVPTHRAEAGEPIRPPTP